MGFGKVFFRKSGKSGPAVGLCHSSRWPAWGIRHDGECPISTLFTGESAMMFRSANILSKWPISVPIRPSWRKVGPTFLGPRNRFVRHPFPLVQHLKMIVQHGKKYVQHGRPICPSSQEIVRHPAIYGPSSTGGSDIGWEDPKGWVFLLIFCLFLKKGEFL